MSGSEAGRKLIMLRHAKSAWPDMSDQDRPLAPRGRRDAPVMGQWLRESGHRPDHVLCSTARRARETWQLARTELGCPEPPTSFDDRIYTGSPRLLLDLVRGVPPGLHAVLIVGHHPALPELALSLAAAGRSSGAGATSPAAVDRMRAKFPTAAVAVFEFGTPWDRLAPGTAALACFVTPRELRSRPGQE
jgi:phosphohistidine phosphatase